MENNKRINMQHSKKGKALEIALRKLLKWF